MTGKLILLSGPSGSGKGVIMSHVRSKYPSLVYPISWTTRVPRTGEKEGKNESGKSYHFVSVDEFVHAKDADAFLEWDHHFNNYYGTPAREVQDALARGQIVFHELEVRGVQQILDKLPRQQTRLIFITASSWTELSRRILAREKMSEDEFEKRRVRYEEEVLFSKNADYILVNEEGKVDETLKKFDQVMEDILAS